jgi:uncharacterized protein (UPF0147 family)
VEQHFLDLQDVCVCKWILNMWVQEDLPLHVKLAVVSQRLVEQHGNAPPSLHYQFSTSARGTVFCLLLPFTRSASLISRLSSIDQEAKLTAYSRTHILGILSLVLFNMAFLIVLWDSLSLFIRTGNLIISLIMPTLLLCGAALFQIRGMQRPKERAPVDPKLKTKLLKLEKDDRFVRRMDTIFLALVPIGLWFASPAFSEGFLRPTYEAAMALMLVLGSLLVPFGIQIKAMAEDSIGGRMDAWVALIAILSIDATYLIYSVFTRRVIMPMLVPHVLGQGTFGAVFGILDFGIPLLVSISFGKRTLNLYAKSMLIRDKEVPKHIRELLPKILLLLVLFSYVSTTVYAAIF